MSHTETETGGSVGDFCPADVPGTPGKSETGNPNDSGYISQSATGNTTPSTTSSEPPSLPDRHVAQKAATKFTRNLFGRKSRLSPILDAKVDEPSRKAFEAIKPRFERLLLEHIRQHEKQRDRYKPMATRLIMMGSSTENATAHIVVFCQPEQKDTVRRFVKTPGIRQLCEGTSACGAPLKFAVLGQAPRLRLAVRVLKDGAVQHTSGKRSTLCGTPILLRHASGKQRKATLGGFVKVLTREGEIRVYGLTAGHAFHDLSEETQKISSGSEERSPSLDSTDENTPEVDDAEDEEDETDDASDIEFDLCVNEQVSGSSTPWAFETTIDTGSVIYPQEATQKRTDYDWALLKTSDYEANKLLVDPKAVITLSHASPGDTGNRRRPIYMISASSGVQNGYLSPEVGTILLGASEKFVDAYMVTLEGQPGICDGDSGSWIVHRNTYELYGHVVATDALGGGYVIPMNRIFDDIQQTLGAMAVGLPDNIDILHCRTVAAESKAPHENSPRQTSNLPAPPSFTLPHQQHPFPITQSYSYGRAPYMYDYDFPEDPNIMFHGPTAFVPLNDPNLYNAPQVATNEGDLSSFFSPVSVADFTVPPHPQFYYPPPQRIGSPSQESTAFLPTPEKTPSPSNVVSASTATQHIYYYADPGIRKRPAPEDSGYESLQVSPTPSLPSSRTGSAKRRRFGTSDSPGSGAEGSPAT